MLARLDFFLYLCTLILCDMTILSIETSTDVCSAALSIGGVPVASKIQEEGSNHAALLPSFLEELLAEARMRKLTIDAVALSQGPGSYTGLRIGASSAKGFCYGAGLPLIPLATTEVLCASFATTLLSPLPKDALLCPMIDARRMEVYTALYDTELRPVVDVHAEVVTPDNFAEYLREHPIYFFGNGAMKCSELIQSENAHFVPDILPDAKCMGVLAEQLTRPRLTGADLAYFDPLYVKDFVAAPSHVKGLN